MDGYLTKPLDLERLTEELGRWIPGTEAPEVPRRVPTREAPPSSKDFDREGFLRRLGGDQELAEEILQAYLEDIPRQMETLAGLVERGQTAQAGLRAHTIKGASANVGAEAMRELAQEMETLGRNGDLGGLEERLPQLETRFLRFREQVEG